jgi:hypothetical protein
LFVVVCDLENLVSEEAIARVELQRHVKKIITIIYLQQTMFFGICSVAAVLYLQSVLHVMLFRP